MPVATVADVIASERAGGSSEDAICELLTRSRIRPPAPHAFRKWTPERLREITGARPMGFTREGRRIR
jgi:hypothetical protein